MNEKIPNLLVEVKAKCCGCFACYVGCPKNAISIVDDDEGFFYPEIDNEKCIGCYKCVRVCPIDKI